MAVRAHPLRLLPSVAAAAGAILLLGSSPTRAREPEMSALGAAIATGSDLLETEIVAEKLEVPSEPGAGPPRFVPARRLVAGDEVHYTIRVRNPGKVPVTGIEVTKRVPDSMLFVPGSATGPACDVDFSVDGGGSYQAKADPERLSHLRWSLRRPLAPGATALLRFRATFR